MDADAFGLGARDELGRTRAGLHEDVGDAEALTLVHDVHSHRGVHHEVHAVHGGGVWDVRERLVLGGGFP